MHAGRRAKDFDWPFKKKPEDIVRAFHAKYTDSQIFLGIKDLDKFKLTFKQFEDALKNKTTSITSKRRDLAICDLAIS